MATSSQSGTLPTMWTFAAYTPPPISSLPGFGSWWSATVDASEASRLLCRVSVAGARHSIESLTPKAQEWWEFVPDFPAPAGVSEGRWSTLGKKMQAQIYALAIAMVQRPFEATVTAGAGIISIDHQAAIRNEDVRQTAGELTNLLLNAMDAGRTKALSQFGFPVSAGDSRSHSAAMFNMGCSLYEYQRSRNSTSLSTHAISSTRDILMGFAEGSWFFVSRTEQILASRVAVLAAGHAHEKYGDPRSCLDKSYVGLTDALFNVTEGDLFAPATGGGGSGGGGGSLPPGDEECPWRDQWGRCIEAEPVRAPVAPDTVKQ